MKQIVLHLLLIVSTSLLANSTKRENIFRDGLANYYSQDFIYKLRNLQIRNRIDYITRIKNQYNLTRDEIAFANATSRSLKLIHDLLNDKITTLKTYSKATVYKNIASEYENLVPIFNQYFNEKYPNIINIDDDTPETLLAELNSSDKKINDITVIEEALPELDILVQTTTNMNATRLLRLQRKAILLIDAYKNEINFIIEGNYEESLPDRIKLAKFCNDNLSSVRDEIENIMFSSNLSIDIFRVLLQRFNLILEILVQGSQIQIDTPNESRHSRYY